VFCEKVSKKKKNDRREIAAQLLPSEYYACVFLLCLKFGKDCKLPVKPTTK